MPSSTCLLEAEETDPLVQRFAGMGLDHDPMQPSQALLQSRPGTQLGLLGAVLDLKPLSRSQTISEEEEDEKRRDEDSRDELLPKARGLTMGSGMEAPSEPVVLFEDGLGESPSQSVSGMMLLPTGYGEPEYEEQTLINSRRKSVTECVGVPSSEHVAEIVGRQGCKIKALRAKTNTYIKTPVRGEQPVFVVTGRKEDVAVAKREILSAAEHFSLIRVSRSKASPLSAVAAGLTAAPSLPGQTTIQVRVPYRMVGLVVGPKGATIKRIQQQTHTYIVTPSRDKEPVFEVTGMPENVDRAREEIEAHIASRTGGCLELPGDDDDFHCNGTDVSLETADYEGGGAWLVSARTITASYRNDSSSSLGSGSGESFYSAAGGGVARLADLSPTSPYNGGGTFWFGETLLPLGAEDLAGDSGGVESVGVCGNGGQMLWSSFDHGGVPMYDCAQAALRSSQPGTPRLSPSLPDALEHPLAQLIQGGYGVSDSQRRSVSGPAFSSSSDSTASCSPPESQYRSPRYHCALCRESDVSTALVPCGHSLLCMECASHICQGAEPFCPKCHSRVTQAIQLRSV
ncbi:RNA-binding E3 ubiquitin-protein ligase MEX3C [Chanos chanos]|uniref:RNA-binding E3 ubiquitin-protein ligase MEX3C n=1 Tax=Chanos chanos TaxID=29144 RepID=A0A6J2WT69_CHACN|nr:RNA-binding E3 ubiquitin-protein ligase MEX3C [Chanos chanos]